MSGAAGSVLLLACDERVRTVVLDVASYAHLRAASSKERRGWAGLSRPEPHPAPLLFEAPSAHTVPATPRVADELLEPLAAALNETEGVGTGE
eukprot:70726-Pleurochrysis_carterae.AAC.3